MIVFKNFGTLSKSSEIFRLSFNTAFIGDDNLLKMNRWQISPEDLHKDKHKFEENF